MTTNKPANSEENTTSIDRNWSDREITVEKEDRFSSKDYAGVLADQAVKADTPLTIGIFGRWGSGKTSLMRLTQAELKTKTTKKKHFCLYAVIVAERIYHPF